MSKPTIIKILNVFENDSASPNTDYSSIYIYKDGPNKREQITLGRGFTECGGALWRVFSRYNDKGGKNGKKLLEAKERSCKGILPDDQEFLDLIHDSCSEQVMKDAQDEIYDEIYWNKGAQWAEQNGFILPLSQAVIQDSFLQSGGILDFLRRRFSSKTPANGGFEKEWIKQYVDVRHNWLANHSNSILHNTIYRTNFFKKQIQNGNWMLDKFPIYPNGVKLSS